MKLFSIFGKTVCCCSDPKVRCMGEKLYSDYLEYVCTRQFYEDNFVNSSGVKDK